MSQCPQLRIIRIESDNNSALFAMNGTEDTLNLLSGISAVGMIQIGTATVDDPTIALRYLHQGIAQVYCGSWVAYLDPTNDRMLWGFGTPIPAIEVSPPYKPPIRMGERVAFEGGMAYNRREMSATGNILSNDTYIGVVSPFNGTADITLTMPDAENTRAGAVIIVKDETNLATTSPGSIIIAAGGTDTVDGGASVSITDPLASIWLINDGVSNWSQFL